MVNLKTVKIYTIGILFIATGLFAEPKISFNPEIKSVVVYPDRAMVTRSKTIRLSAGRHTLLFSQASPHLEDSSLRAFARNPAIIVRGVNSWIERRSQTLNPMVRGLENELQALQRNYDADSLSLQRIHSEVSGLNDYANYLKRSIVHDSKVGPKSTSTRWQKALSFITQRRQNAATGKRNLQNRLKKNLEKKYVLQAKLRKLQLSSRKAVRMVEIRLQAKKTVTTVVGFAYMMHQASWQVSYGMHYKGSQVYIEYYGNIKQLTGEDWSKVKVSLSTSKPAVGAARPDLIALNVIARKVETKTSYIQDEQKAEEESDDDLEITDASSDKDTGGFAGLDSGGNSIMFRIRRKANISSSKRQFRLTIAKFNLNPSNVYFRIVPAQQQVAYLTAKVVNSQAFPMLAGQVDVYRKSGFMGRSRISHTPPNGHFLLNLGSDRNLFVERKVKHFRQSAGVLSSNKIFKTSVHLTIHNKGNRSNQIGLYERIPVSETEDVTIRILKNTSSGYKETAKDSGILLWNFALAAGAKKQIILTYEAEVPANFPGTIFGK